MLKSAFDAALAEYELVVDARRARNDKVFALLADRHHDAGEGLRRMWCGDAIDVLDEVENALVDREGPAAAAAGGEALLTCLPGRPLRQEDVRSWVGIARMIGAAGIELAVALYRDELQHSPGSLWLECDRIESARLDPLELLQLTAERRLTEPQLHGVVGGLLRGRR
jgi:hypothetical protein